MKNPLEGMTQDRWESLTPMERDRLRSDAGLTPQLVGVELAFRAHTVCEHLIKAAPSS